MLVPVPVAGPVADSIPRRNLLLPLLDAVLAATAIPRAPLLVALYTGRVQCATNNVVPNAGQVTNPTASHQDN